MTTSGRLMSPALSFTSALQGAQAPTSQAKGTITKTEAEKALAQLSGHPHATAAERATIVQAFIDGSDATSLSPKAKDVLADFVKQQAQAGGGQRADELKAAATTAAQTAERSLTAARTRLQSLLAEGGRVKKSDLTPVQQALDGARVAVDAARQSLTGVLQVADHGAQLAAAQLGDAKAEIAKAQADVARLVAQKGGVTRKTIDTVTGWLADPVQELQAAQKELGSVTAQSTGGHSPGEITLKFPSDAEDGGAGSGMMVSMKYPSDHEDGGPGPGGPARPGPGTLPPLGGVKQVRLDAMRKVFADADARGTQWYNSMPLGARTETAMLHKENHPDGFQFDALIPVGALTPTAQRADVNTVDSFWVRRMGGIAGLTQYAGPFSLKGTPTL